MSKIKRQQIYRIAWWMIALALVAGMSLPMFTFTTFYFFDDTYSLFAGIFHLLDAGEVGLFVLVFCFSILVPVYKMYLLYQLILAVGTAPCSRDQNRMKRLDLIGKWSMLDVFVIAILVVTVKMATIAQIEVHYGLYLFTMAVMGSMMLTQLIRTGAGDSDGRASGEY